ncbi:MAG: hypothetical protein JSW21_01460 [Gammaproteobacteria bacterium]|jgi:hypothetical protein|nr:MAG: hypothetical protein JSW21_01460 [Gammaproteobacteria bacterium]
MSDIDKKQIESRSKAIHDEAVAALEPQVRARLAEGRQRALAGSRRLPLNDWLLPAGAIGAAMLAGIVFLSSEHTTEYADLVAADDGVTDMELILVAGDLDMLSDLDFFLWLDTEPDSG